MEPTVEEWEKTYERILVETLHPKGDVLEIGFDSITEQIQTYQPTSHTIIEYDPKTATKAKIWAAKHKKTSVIEGRWENILPQLKTFDTVFFGKASNEKKTEEFEEMSQSLSTKNEVVLMVEKKHPYLKTMKYCDQDLDEFCKKISSQKEELSLFLQELMKNGQISQTQHENMSQKYGLKKPEKSNFQKIPDVSLFFFNECKKHMKKKGRYCCFLNDPTSKYENPEFFDQVITSSHFDYQEKMIPISPSKHYPFNEALIMVIEKL